LVLAQYLYDPGCSVTNWRQGGIGSIQVGQTKQSSLYISTTSVYKALLCGQSNSRL